METENNTPYSNGLFADAGVIMPVEVVHLMQFNAQVKVLISTEFEASYVDYVEEEKAVHLIYRVFPDLSLIIQGSIRAAQIILEDDDEESISYLSSHIATEIFCKLNNIEL